MNSNRFKQNVTPEKDILDKYKQNLISGTQCDTEFTEHSFYNISVYSYMYLIAFVSNY